MWRVRFGGLCGVWLSDNLPLRWHWCGQAGGVLSASKSPLLEGLLIFLNLYNFVHVCMYACGGELVPPHVL